MSAEQAVEAHLAALLRQRDPARSDVEAALTHGHAEVLALEAERLRIQRKLDRIVRAEDPRLNDAATGVRRELALVNQRLRMLLGRLAEIADRFGSGARFIGRAGQAG